jgi:hypothetical protein
MMRCGCALGVTGLACLLPLSASALQAVPEGDLLNLFFDCPVMGCDDPDFFRREVPFVNWVRDSEVSDVHVFVTSQLAGGGGRQYTLVFIGVGDLEGVDQELSHASAGDATVDDIRNGLVEKLKLGLVRYVQGTAVADRLRVSFEGRGEPGAGSMEAATAGEDAWDFWVFSLNGDGFINGQSTSRFSNLYGSASANRTTEAWKLEVEGNSSQFIQEFEVPEDDGTVSTVRETREDWGAGGSVVRSIGPKWALGVRAEVGSSTFFNQNLRASIKPGLEYNIFPYSESSRRSLTLQYLIGPNHFSYNDTTIFRQTEETRLQESVTTRLSLVAPWGRWSTSVTGAHYLHDAGKYNVSISGNLNVRLFRGFSVRVSGNYSWIRDQLFVSASGATQEEILLQQRQLETSYRYFTSFGIEYRFGSIFNNVVNPRFGPAGAFF